MSPLVYLVQPFCKALIRQELLNCWVKIVQQNTIQHRLQDGDLPQCGNDSQPKKHRHTHRPSCDFSHTCKKKTCNQLVLAMTLGISGFHGLCHYCCTLILQNQGFPSSKPCQPLPLNFDFGRIIESHCNETLRPEVAATLQLLS